MTSDESVVAYMEPYGFILSVNLLIVLLWSVTTISLMCSPSLS